MVIQGSAFFLLIPEPDVDNEAGSELLEKSCEPEPDIE
jgi:hypothetical protein